MHLRGFFDLRKLVRLGRDNRARLGRPGFELSWSSITKLFPEKPILQTLPRGV